MRIFKNKIFRRIVLPLLTVCMLILLDTGIGELLRPVTYASWFGSDVSRLEASGQTADIVFVGASRTHRTFVPLVFEEKMGLDCVVNAASASQPISATYFALKDMIERMHPKRVFLGVTWNGLRGGTSLQGRLIVHDRISLGNKLLMAAQAFDISEWPYLSAVYRFKDNFTLHFINYTLEEKAEVKATAVTDTDRTEDHDNGYEYRRTGFENGNVPIDKTSGFYEDQIKSKNLEWLDRCVALCRENNIEVTLVSGVTSVSRLYTIRHYQDAVDYFRAYAEKNGILYYNLNLLKDRESFLPDEMMHDTNHVNGDGALIVSEKFAEILNAEAAGEDTSVYFYENLDAFKRDVHRIVAVNAELTQDPEEPTRYQAALKSLHNEDIPAQYRVLVRYGKKGEYSVLQDWTDATELTFSVERLSGCTVRVEAGSADESIGRAFQEYSLGGKKARNKTENADEAEDED